MSDPENFLSRWSRRKRAVLGDASLHDNCAASSPPPPCGEGLGVGVGDRGTSLPHGHDPPPRPSPSRNRVHAGFSHSAR